MKKPIIQLARSNFLWFEAFHPNHPEVIISDYDPENPAVDFSGNFDYELSAKGTRCVYIDIEIRMIPVGAILVRSDFEFESNGGGSFWDELFTIDFIYPMVNLALHESVAAFEDQCEQLQIKLPFEIPFSSDIVSLIGKNIVDQYLKYRKPDDIQNAFFKNTIGLECTQGNATFVTIQATFLIIDELIYNNPLFNRKHNKAVLSMYIPESKYNTIKMNCLEIVDHPVKLYFYDTILFYTCVDCALQMLLGDKSDLLINALEENGMVKEFRDAYFKHGTELFNQLHKNLSKSHARITNLEEQHDWNKLFK